MEPYDTIDSIFEKLATGVSAQEIRRDIAELIRNCLEQMRDSLGYWEKEHFLFAISALAWNRSPPQEEPTDIWLRLCLVSLEKAFTPKDERGEEQGSNDAAIEDLTYEQLVRNLEYAA